MELFPGSSTCLDLTISITGFSSSPFPSLPSSGGEGCCLMRDLDINQVPTEEQEECMDEEDESPNGRPPRKKLRLTKEQSHLLEESFKQHHTLNPKQKEVLAKQLQLKPRQVEVWFQNRRARTKLKQNEMEFDYLKRWVGSLSEQNRRLQKEVEELRAMKVSPPTVMSPYSHEPLLASTLTVCPRCERVTTTGIGTDKGPTKAATTTTTTTTTTLSSKVNIINCRHPSAAC